MTMCEGFTASVELTEGELVLHRKLTKTTGLVPEWRVPTSSLSGVRLKPAGRIIHGYVQFEVAGEPRVEHPTPGDPCAVFYTRKQAPAFEALAAELTRIVERNEIAGERDSVMGDADRQAVQNALAAQRETVLDKFKGIRLTPTEVLSDDGSGPVAGAQAQVDTAGNLTFRSTLTRSILLPGLAGLAFQKREDKRELYLVIEGEGFSIVKKLNADFHGKRAREFAAKVNAQAKAAAGEEATSEPRPAPRKSERRSAAEALSELLQLKQAGLISEEEFEVKRREVLARV